jgi:PAS domain S-box-containing protein
MSGTDERIRVLHVDDDQRFVDTAAKFLERSDDRISVRTATSPDDGLAALADDDVDCIVSDYDMPRTNGIEFFHAVEERYDDLPFILFTGKGSEEVASEAISAGVTDYLQKQRGTDHYTILANRIRNAVSAQQTADDAQRRRHRLEQILKTVPSCVVQLDYEGRFVFANDRAVDVLGLEEAGLTDRAYDDPEWQIRDLDGDPIPDEDLPFRQVRDSGEPLYGFRHTIVWPDGTRKLLVVNGAPLFDADGDVESVVFSLSDVTEEREREALIRKTTTRLTALFENSPNMINVHDAEGNIVEPNPRFREKTGYDPEELADIKVWELDQDIDREEARALWDGMAVGDRREIEGRYQRRDGSTFPVEIHLRRLDFAGEDRFMAISRDVTDRKDRERDLEAARRRLEAIRENTTMPMFMKDDDGRYVFVNRGYRELFDLTDEEVVGRTDHEIHPPAVAERVGANDRAVVEGDESIDVEEEIRVDGEQRTFLTSKVPVYDTGYRADPEHPVAVFGVGSDVTDLKSRERKVRELQRRSESLIRASTHEEIADIAVGIAEGVLDLPLSSVHLVDDQHERLEPVALTDAIREHHGDDHAYDRSNPSRATETTNWEIFERGETVVVDDVQEDDRFQASETPSRSGIVHPLGSHGLFITSSPDPRAFDEGDVALTEILAALVTATLDRTERENSLGDRKRQLETETERLEEFSRVVSHDLRNPLNVAEGHLDLLLEQSDSEHLDVIRESHDRMSDLIEDLLLLARQGETATDVTAVDLQDSVEKAWRNVETAEATLHADLDRVVQADESRLRQLFENLVRNAVEHGGDAVTVTVGELDDGFYVEDDGPGIQAEDPARLFEAGYSTTAEGTGFGLRIVEQVADAHGWTLRATDAEDGGARFEVTGAGPG